MVNTWQNLLRGGFACMEAPFAVHPKDARRAREMVFVAQHASASLQDICDEARRHLEQQGCNADSIARQLERVAGFYKSVKFQVKKKRAWLVRWESTEEPVQEQSIIAIFDSRKSSDFVADFVQQFYISHTCSIEEKVHYSSHSKEFPYQVEYERVRGAPWLGSMSCGHNPFITARVVEHLSLATSKDGATSLHWLPVNRPSLP